MLLGTYWVSHFNKKNTVLYFVLYTVFWGILLWEWEASSKLQQWVNSKAHPVQIDNLLIDSLKCQEGLANTVIGTVKLV